MKTTKTDGPMDRLTHRLAKILDLQGKLLRDLNKVGAPAAAIRGVKMAVVAMDRVERHVEAFMWGKPVRRGR